MYPDGVVQLLYSALTQAEPDWYESQWFTTLLAAIVGATLGAFLGTFQKVVRYWFLKPVIAVSISCEPPDCHITSVQSSSGLRFDGYYLRFRVENTGKSPLEHVEAMIVEVFERLPNGELRRRENFLPLNLVWSYYCVPTTPIIQPNLFKHLDLGHIFRTEHLPLQHYGISTNSKVMFEMDTAVKPFSGSHILPPGEYQFVLKLAASYVETFEKRFSLVIADGWSDEPREMLSRNVAIRPI